MAIDRKQVAKVLKEIARLSELKGENPYRCRAFESAARTIERSDADIEELVRSESLTSIRGIGKGTAEQIRCLVLEGKAPLLEELHALFPKPLRRLLDIPGLGPKRLRVIHEKLGVSSVGELEYAILENRLRDLPGFGTKSQDALREAIETLRRHEGRFLLPVAWRAAAEALIQEAPDGRRVEIAGELRRQLETISEVLFIAEAPFGAEPSEKTATSSEGMPVRILSRPPETFGACWLWESSSSEHRTSLQEIARKKGWDFDGRGLLRDGEILDLSEEEIYRALDLEPAHPLLREGSARVPAVTDPLAAPESIRGVFHVHTTDSDGAGTIEEMVREAKRLGFTWIGISDHSQTAFYANGLSPERLRAQRRSVQEVQDRYPEIRIFHGIESDILGDGGLDYEDDLLEVLDFVVASVHGQFRMDRATMTKRIEAALRHPATTHWGHPTGRLLLARDGYDCDVDALLKVCAEQGVSVEFNANPHRLDLDWRLIGRARELGIPISVNPDAHTTGGLSDARLTVGTAAKGGLRVEEPLNARSGEEIAAWLKDRKQKTKIRG